VSEADYEALVLKLHEIQVRAGRAAAAARSGAGGFLLLSAMDHAVASLQQP
jgi:hypothetical protein